MRSFKFLIGLITILIYSTSDSYAQTTERVYLQADKSAYISGEIVWFKLITTDERGLPQNLSKVAYIEILNESAAVAQTKVDLSEGIGSGSIIIPPSVRTGVYRLTAYTAYMRNESSAVFWETFISVVNPLESVSDNPGSIQEFLSARGPGDAGAEQYSNYIEKLRKEISIVQNKMDAAVADMEFNEAAKYKDEIAGLQEKLQYELEIRDKRVTEGGISLSVSSDKKVYSTRDKVVINLSGLPEDTYTLSVSVTGDNYMLYKFNEGIAGWKQWLPASKRFTIDIIPEYEGHIIKGSLVEQSSGQAVKTISNESISLLEPMLSFPGALVRLFPGKIMPNGDVLFPTKNTAGCKGIITTLKGQDAASYKININPPYYNDHPTTVLPGIRHEDVNSSVILSQSVGVQAMYAFLNDTLNTFIESAPLFNRKPSNSYVMDEYAKFASMGEVITEFVYDARFRRINRKMVLFLSSKPNNPHDILVMLDGIPVFDHDIIYNYNPLLISRIDVYDFNLTLGGKMYHGMIHFTTTKHNYPELKPDPSTVFFDYEGTQAKRLFYSPVYVTDKDVQSRLPDSRHTLYWNPDVQINNRNTAVDFYTSDMEGNYEVVIEGITTTGEVFRTTTGFKVIR